MLNTMIIVAINKDLDFNIQYFVNFKKIPFRNPEKKQNKATPIHLKET